MLITFKNYHYWDLDSNSPDASKDIFAFEMVPVDRIIHIYQVMPEKNLICVEYTGHDGVVRFIHECFKNASQASSRILQLERLLRGEKK